jgi:hypothetical protein
VILKCGVVKGLGLPLLIGGDAIKAMGLRTYDTLPVATIERKHIMGILSLEQAQKEAQESGDTFWGATIEEEHRQVHRATIVAGCNRVTIPPWESRMIRLNGCTDLLPEDVSTVNITIFNKDEAKLAEGKLIAEGGIHAGVPQIVVANKSSETVILYRGQSKQRLHRRESDINICMISKHRRKLKK